jgi:hypothetical protein
MAAFDESAKRLSAGLTAVVFVPLQEVNPIATEKSANTSASIRFFATVLMLFIIRYLFFVICYWFSSSS